MLFQINFQPDHVSYAVQYQYKLQTMSLMLFQINIQPGHVPYADQVFLEFDVPRRC
jgi:hypothetical protein